MLDVLPWTLSALVLGGAAASRGHVITGHTAPVTTRDQTSAWLEVSMDFANVPQYSEKVLAL